MNKAPALLLKAKQAYYFGTPIMSDAQYDADLCLPVAQTLAHFRGDIDLDDLESVTDAAAEALSVHQGDLSLDGLTTLSPTAAKSLARHKGSLSFFGLKSLSTEVAEALAVHGGYIGLGDEACAALECAEKRLARI
jgi:hypothetical protein